MSLEMNGAMQPENALRMAFSERDPEALNRNNSSCGDQSGAKCRYPSRLKP